jgi:hypothetical protein
VSSRNCKEIASYDSGATTYRRHGIVALGIENYALSLHSVPSVCASNEIGGCYELLATCIRNDS